MPPDSTTAPQVLVVSTPQLREVVLDDDLVDQAVAAVIEAAKTDKIGDGKIFVSTVEQAIRIRTGESGSDAL